MRTLHRADMKLLTFINQIFNLRFVSHGMVLLHSLIAESMQWQEHPPTNSHTRDRKRCSIEKLQAVIACVCDDDAAVEVNGHIPGRLELTVTAAPTSYGA